MTTGQKIKALRLEKGMSQEELGAKIGVKKAAINKYETGVVVNLKKSTIAKLAEALDTSPIYLMGWESESLSPLPPNVMPLPKMKKVPLVGQIACGTPILAEENITDYIDLPGHIRADYALLCKGDSMVNAGIQDGDIVYIRQQEEVENGQIAAVLVDEDEATLKRFYRMDGKVTLNAENPVHAPLVYVGDEISHVRVIGLAVAFTHVIE